MFRYIYIYIYIYSSLHVNADKTEYMYFNQEGDFSILNGDSLRLGDNFTHFDSSVSFTESDINMRLAKIWTAIGYRSYGSLTNPIR